MTTPINALTDSSSTASSETASKANGAAMDKQSFLKLLVAQISTQDPMSPMQGAEFVSQLSQFAVVEQAISQSSKLDMVANQIRGLANNEAASLVGKTVSASGHGLEFDGMLASSTQVSLSSPATKVVATVLDANGNPVRTLDLGPKPPGALTISWDGRDNAGGTAKAGKYTVDVKAFDATGKPVSVSQGVSGVVTQVSYEKGYPELLLDNGTAVSIADLVSVGITKSSR